VRDRRHDAKPPTKTYVFEAENSLSRRGADWRMKRKEPSVVLCRALVSLIGALMIGFLGLGV
jgi:uncharacterized membrane protein